MSHFMFDFDETLVKGDIIEAVSKDLLKQKLIDRIYTGKDVSDFDLTGLPEILKSKVIAAFSDPKYVLLKKAIPEAYHFLCALKTNGHDISILTARPQSIKNETIVTWINEFPGIQLKELIFANKGQDVKTGDARPNKKVYLENIQPDYYFDDAIEYCNMAADLDIKTYLISNSYTGWNKDRVSLNPKVSVIKNISKFPEVIHGI